MKTILRTGSMFISYNDEPDLDYDDTESDNTMTKEEMESTIFDKCRVGNGYSFANVTDQLLVDYVNSCDAWDYPMVPEIMDYFAARYDINKDAYEDYDAYGQAVIEAAEDAL